MMLRCVPIHRGTVVIRQAGYRTGLGCVAFRGPVAIVEHTVNTREKKGRRNWVINTQIIQEYHLRNCVQVKRSRF